LQSLWNAHESDAGRCPDTGRVAVLYLALLRLGDCVSGGCSGGGGWLRRVLDSGCCIDY